MWTAQGQVPGPPSEEAGRHVLGEPESHDRANPSAGENGEEEEELG